MANPKEKTPMCLVNELARFNRIQPQYKLLKERGPAHAKVNTAVKVGPGYKYDTRSCHVASQRTVVVIS